MQVYDTVSCPNIVLDKIRDGLRFLGDQKSVSIFRILVTISWVRFFDAAQSWVRFYEIVPSPGYDFILRSESKIRVGFSVANYFSLSGHSGMVWGDW